ncbi:AAA family ATPase [Poseidonocella sedimentorum]|uniref:MoxR-like ATPase n=1 Tax=Poseidonocella sedimentorum TaxID=871652 RepID=A0A1I6CW50_9RHOB|nr:AAA family ATPase [Poseidonocella sedimentorum]SFQ97418.1 MoxR-like ATPase [Poseidonocella sedimentorum]
MFEKEILAKIFKAHKNTLTSLVSLQDSLNARFYGLEQTIECMMLSAITGEAMLMLGPPGTAKSRLTRTFCQLVGLLPNSDRTDASAQGDDRYFEYLLTQFTEPSELFGYFDLGKLMGDAKALVRDDEGMMQKAEVVFLDEVFNASSAILNALLTFMNERKFHDRGMVHPVPLQILFAASNHPPREEGLGAVYDRFVLRSRIENVASDQESISGLLETAWTETHGRGGEEEASFAGLLPSLTAYRETVDEMTLDGRLSIQQTDPIFARLADLVTEVRRKGLSEMSNRRLVKLSAVVLGNALLRHARNPGKALAIEPVDLTVLLKFGLDTEDESTVSKLTSHLLGT